MAGAGRQPNLERLQLGRRRLATDFDFYKPLQRLIRDGVGVFVVTVIREVVIHRNHLCLPNRMFPHLPRRFITGDLTKKHTERFGADFKEDRSVI